ncbi:MAG: YbaK/EbsC family protein [bacterium]
MLQSKIYIPTRRETPKEAESRTHALLLRAGVIREIPSGARVYLPVGQRALRKLEEMIREELSAEGAMEIHVPLLSPRNRPVSKPQISSEVSGFSDFEETLVSLVGGDLRSYRDLPRVFFAFMCNAHGGSFCAESISDGASITVEGCSFSRTGKDPSPIPVKKAFEKIFHRLELKTVQVNSGDSLLEYIVPLEGGACQAGTCSSCAHSSRLELFPLSAAVSRSKDQDSLERVYTPCMTSVEEVAGFLGCPIDRLVKTMIYSAGERTVAVLLRGDHTVSESKLRNLLNQPVELASAEIIEQVTGAPVGFAGPVGLKGLDILADYGVRSVGPAITGANEADHHFRGVVLDRDYQVNRWADLRSAEETDLCGKCGAGTIDLWTGVELAGIRFPESKISRQSDLWYTDEDGKSQPLAVGRFRMNVSRLFANSLEVHPDDRGLTWPADIAPFDVHVLNLAPHQSDVHSAACNVIERLEAEGLEVLHDDRNERPGVKFNDAELLGFPYLVVVGAKSLREGCVEIGRRDERERRKVLLDEIPSLLLGLKQMAGGKQTTGTV